MRNFRNRFIRLLCLDMWIDKTISVSLFEIKETNVSILVTMETREIIRKRKILQLKKKCGESCNYTTELVYSEIRCNENLFLTSKKNGWYDIQRYNKIPDCDKGNFDITNHIFLKRKKKSIFIMLSKTNNLYRQKINFPKLKV